MKKMLLCLLAVFVWACFGFDPEQLPDVSKLGPLQTQNALPVAEWGWGNLENGDRITDIPFQRKQGISSLSIPFDTQFADFALKKVDFLSRIVIIAEQLKPYQIEGNELDRMTVYVSSDGKSYAPVKTEVATQFYTVTDHTGKKIWVRISLSGEFYGKYFRIFAPWGKKGYVFRFANGPNGVKAFAKLNFKNFSVPMSTSGNLDCTFALTGIRDMKGRVILRLKDGPVLAEKSLAEMTDGTVTTFSVFLKDLPAGIHTIQVDGVRNDGIVLGSCSRKFAYYPDKVVLKNTKSAAWQIRNILAGKRKLPFWRATTVGAKMEYMIPQDGVFSIYAVIRGEGKFRFTVSGNVREHVALDLWSPKYDRNPYVFGENFLGIYRLRSGDIISFTAEDAGAFLGEVFLRPANGEQLKIYMDKTPEGKFQSIIAHGDGFSDFFFKEMTLQIMQDRIAELKRSGVIAYDWCIGTSATNYPSKIATMFGKQRDVKFSRKRDQLAAERMEKLNHTTGKDSLQIFREETRKHHMPYSITLRANAFYGSKIEMDKNAQYLIDHPEFFIVEPWGKRLKPSYAYREIRDFYLALAKEIATYKPDILTIEFLRHPPFFGYDRPLVEQYRRLYGSCDKRNYMDERWLNMIGQIMTDWIGEVRREIKKIHPDIELMINFDCEHYREQGIDITTILKRGLVDGISPGFYGIGSQKYFALKPFRDMIEQAPNKVKLYPRVEAVIKGHDPTPEEEAGLVKRPVQITVSNNLWKSVFYKFIQDGADGIRPFNGGSSGLARRLNDRAEVKRFATFTEPLLDIRYFGVEEK